MLKEDLTPRIINWTDHSKKQRTRNASFQIKDELGGKIMEKRFGLKAKLFSYLIDDSSEDKEAKDTKKCVIKRKLKFEDHENHLEGTQLKNKTNYLEKKQFPIQNN